VVKGGQGKALFLDRDGTLIRDCDYLADPDRVDVLPGVPEALGRARRMGYLMFLFTNQSGVGRGYFGMEAVEAVNRRMEELIGLEPPLFREIGIAPEAPVQPHMYRKPSPRFILEMIERYALDPERCWMAGDSESDVLAGINAGIRAAALATGKNGDPSNWPEVAEHRVPVFVDLRAFVATLEET